MRTCPTCGATFTPRAGNATAPNHSNAGARSGTEAAIQRVRELLDDECFSQCSCGRCPVHCLDEDADVCWCGDFPAVGCPTHLPAPGGVG